MLVLLIGLLICRTVFLQPTVTWQDDAHGSKTAIQNKIFLLIGDSMMGGATGYFLSDSLKAEGARSVIIDFHTSSGLCRPDFFNWNEQLNTLLISHDFDIAMVFIGANDNQSIHRYTEGWIRYHTDEWYDEYNQRVGNIMDMLLIKADRVYWIGLPKMINPEFDEGIVVLNSIYEEQANLRNNVFYISSYELFDNFSSASYYQPLNPTYSSLRAEDGCHLTARGARILVQKIIDFITR